MLQEERRRLMTVILVTALIVGAATYAITRAVEQRNNTTRQDQLQTEINDLKNQLNATSSNQAPTTFTTPAATADWQTYSNSANGFSIQYPKDWKVTTGVSGSEAIITNFDYSGQTALQTGQTDKIITVVPNVSSTSPTSIYATLTSPGERIAAVQTLKTANASAMVFKIEKNGVTFYRALIPENNKIIVIESRGDMTDLNEMIESIIVTS